jgi:hypothetical protein
MTKKLVQALLCLLSHSQEDMNFFGGGTFNVASTGDYEHLDDFNAVDAKKVLMAHMYIKKLIEADGWELKNENY